MTTPSIDTLMRWIAHYAEDTATLHKYETALYRDDEQAARWRKTVDRRHDEVGAAIVALTAADPGLHMRLADTIQREIEDNTTADGRLAQAEFLAEQIAHALCAEVPEIARAVR
jgi:hypothetical protein